jgi:hypothetical protein
MGRIGFGWDQERDALAATNILAGKLTLLGPRVQGPTGFFLPPYFFYILAPFYAVTAGNPTATSVFIIFWSTVFFAGSYLVISKIFDRTVALMFLALWAVNPLAVSIDTIAWNPVVIPGLLMLLIYAVYLFYKNQKKWNVFLIGLVFGLGVSFHTQFIFTSLVFSPLILDLLKRKKFRQFAYMLARGIIPFIPILIFDLRHNFLNIKQLLGYSVNSDLVGNRVLTVWSHVASFATGLEIKDWIGVLVYLLVSVGLIYAVLHIKDLVQKKIFTGMSLTWILTLPVFYVGIRNPSEYYFNFLLVILLLLVAFLANKWKRVGIIMLLLLSLSFVYRALPLLNDIKLSLREKSAAVLFLGRVTQEAGSFNVSFNVPANEDSGFRYLLKFQGVKYSGDPKDPLIEFEIPPSNKSGTFSFGDIGIYFPEGWTRDNWIR